MHRPEDNYIPADPPNIYRATFISSIKNKVLRRFMMITSLPAMIAFNITMPLVGAILSSIMIFIVSVMENVETLFKSFKEKW